MFAAVVALATTDARAAGIIRNPGDHPKYGVELEPHGLLRWNTYYYGDTGFGLGFHAVIPLMDNGPIQKINNNMGIGFGFDWAHYSENYCFGYGPFFVRGVPANAGCSAYGNAFMFPVFMQWNFFLTEIVSVYGEAGFGISDETYGFNNYYLGACPVGVDCSTSGSHLEAFPYFEGGGRFLFGDTVGLMVRIGYPLLTVGAVFLL